LWIDLEGNDDAFSFCSDRKRRKRAGWKLGVGEEKGGPMIEAAHLQLFQNIELF
jgi:hypothetical protein